MGQCGLISSLFTFEAERYCLFCFFFVFLSVWPEGGNFPVLWDFWPKRGDRFLRMGICGINSKRGGF